MVPSCLDRLIEICEAIEKEARSAALIYAAYQPTAANKAILSRFQDTYEAWTFITIRESLHRDLVMTLARLWDPPGDVASILTAMHRLKNDRMVKLLVNGSAIAAAKRRQNSHVIIQEGQDESLIREMIRNSIPEAKDEAMRRKRLQIATLRRMVTRATRLPEFESLRDHRNEVLAHASVRRIKAPTGTSPRPIKWGDEHVLLKATIAIAEKLSMVVCDHQPNIDDAARIHRDYARRYWACTQPPSNRRKP